MEPDVYICYSSDDKNAADAICHVLEENKFKCWIKPRDLGIKHIAEEITEAIRASKSMVLVFSESAKVSNYVNTEVDIAFSSNVPIVVFKIDDSKLDGGLEFFLENKHWLDAYPNPSHEFGQLVIDVSKLLDKPIAEPIVSKEVVNSLENLTIPNAENKVNSEGRNKYFLKIFTGMCLLPIVLSVAGAMISPSGSIQEPGGILVLIGLAFFILTPAYVIAKYIFNNVL